MNGIGLRRIGVVAIMQHGDGTSLDTFESYNDATDLSGLNNGLIWNGAFVVFNGAQPSTDTFEAYSDTANLNTLNGGTNWAGAFVAR